MLIRPKNYGAAAMIAWVAALGATAALADVPVEAPGTTKPTVTPQPPSESSDNPSANQTETPVNPPGNPKQSLSEQLDESEGVIVPPKGVDPEIKLSPPEGFKSEMPVLTPPGDPGGDQSIQPK